MPKNGVYSDFWRIADNLPRLFYGGHILTLCANNHGVRLAGLIKFDRGKRRLNRLPFLGKSKEKLSVSSTALTTQTYGKGELGKYVTGTKTVILLHSLYF